MHLTKAQLLFLLMCDFTAYGDRAEFRSCDSSLGARLPKDSTLIPGMFIASWEKLVLCVLRIMRLAHHDTRLSEGREAGHSGRRTHDLSE